MIYGFALRCGKGSCDFGVVAASSIDEAKYLLSAYAPDRTDCLEILGNAEVLINEQYEGVALLHTT